MSEPTIEDLRARLAMANRTIRLLRVLRVNPDDVGMGEEPASQRPAPYPDTFEPGTHDDHECEWIACADCRAEEDPVCECDAVRCEWCDVYLCDEHAVRTNEGNGCRYCVYAGISMHEWDYAHEVVKAAIALRHDNTGTGGLALTKAVDAYRKQVDRAG